MRDLLETCRKAEDWQIELVCVQNGSQDRTGEILHELASTNNYISVVEVRINHGYGFGIRQGMQAASGEIVGYLDGDGQIAPQDVLRVLDRMRVDRAAKAVRTERKDGARRGFVSFCYNRLFRLLLGVPVQDANAKPKFLRKEDLAKLSLVSNDWFIDAEIMIKISALGIGWSEIPVEFHRRARGASNVRLRSIVEFLRNMARWRFGGLLEAWKQTTSQS